MAQCAPRCFAATTKQVINAYGEQLARELDKEAFENYLAKSETKMNFTLMKQACGLIILIFAFILLTAIHSEKPVKIIFFGDSITELGVKPGGYIERLRRMLKERQPAETEYQLTGAGISGNKVYDLYLRLEDDVLSQKPDLVFLYVGVNDVWHKKSFGTGTDADKFGRFYEALLKKLAARDIGAVLCTPAVIGEKANGANELDNDLNQYSQIIRNIAGKYDYPLCDLRQAFLDYLAKNNPANKASGVLTTDGVHLNDAGNQFVAEQMVKFIRAR
jgi:lysophospholipase L1-like esterase